MEEKFEELEKAHTHLADIKLIYHDDEIRVVHREILKVPRQMQKIREDQVENAAGGYVFAVSDETQVRRFLIIGSDKNSYYETAEKITLDNAKHIAKIIAKGNGLMVLRELFEINRDNRNPKMSSMIFTLAICARIFSHDTSKKTEDQFVKAYSNYIKELHAAALRILPLVCRTPTHLFEFVDYCETIANNTKAGTVRSSTGWGRAMRTAIEDWYIGKSTEQLAMLLTKYPQRGGWSHRDLFRLAHVKLEWTKEDAWYLVKNQLYRYAVKGKLMERELRKMKKNEENENKDEGEKKFTEEQMEKEETSKALNFIEAYLSLTSKTSFFEISEAIRKFGLVREHLPTTCLNSNLVWEALLKAPMPMTALIRNLNKLTLSGALANNRNVIAVTQRLMNQEELKMARIHPLTILTAQAIYKKGKGEKGKLKWTPIPEISKALEVGFYRSFVNSPPTGKRFCLAIDVSGSMWCPVSSSPLMCCEAAAAMSLITMRNEEYVKCMAFCDHFTELPFNKSWTIPKVLNYMRGLDFGATNCALPMLWAIEKKLKFDVFIIYTDNETWFGDIHPFEAIKMYRKASGIHDAKVIVMAMTAVQYTIADPSDSGMLDVAGFDSAVPQIIHEFVTGNI